MSLWEWLSLASVCFAGAASPGPSLAVVLDAVLRGGRGNGIIAAWAHALGVGLYAALTVFGISALLLSRPELFTLLQVCGALYLLWMAARLLRSTASDPAVSEDAPSHVGRAARDAFAVAFLNPKLAVFMLALFSQFIRPDAELSESALLIATATGIDGAWYTLVALLLSRGSWLDTLRRNATRIDRGFGALLAILALSILWFSLQRVLSS
ncbi:MAG: LysE family translocator [Pseudomonadota bacterium]